VHLAKKKAQSIVKSVKKVKMRRSEDYLHAKEQKLTDPSLNKEKISRSKPRQIANEAQCPLKELFANQELKLSQ
jgi:hypothetical protein